MNLNCEHGGTKWRPGQPFDAALDCFLCFKYNTDAEYRAFIDGPESEAHAAIAHRRATVEQVALVDRSQRIKICRHKGERLGTVRCPSCAGTVMVFVFGCDLHSRCTLVKPVADHACCQKCPDYDPKGE